MKDHYSALGVSSAATLAEIKTAYRRQAALQHPDRNAAEGAAARFRGVQEAYEVLSDEVRRAAYDNNRKRNLLDDPLETAGAIWARPQAQVISAAACASGLALTLAMTTSKPCAAPITG